MQDEKTQTESEAAWQKIREAKRIVVKIGSNTLTNAGRIRPRRFTSIAGDVAKLMQAGKQVALVSSGAIALGAHRLGWQHFGRTIREKQAAAAVGQIGLVDLYQRRFALHDLGVGQVLLTRSGLEDRERFLNARHTMLELLELGIVPIVNENDTVATEEIRFGDNDNLAATIVNAIDADLLVILTDVEGLYETAPVKGRPKPPLIQTVREITPEIEEAASGSGTRAGSGGMITKLEAAKSAAFSGAATVLCLGSESRVLERLLAGEKLGTLFSPEAPAQQMNSRKHWLAFTRQPAGTLQLDDGAEKALVEDGRSLLPAGIKEVKGDFEIGEAIRCVNGRGQEVARGLAGYSSLEIAQLAGCSTSEIEPMLGYSRGDEIIHRDDLVLMGEV